MNLLRRKIVHRNWLTISSRSVVFIIILFLCTIFFLCMNAGTIIRIFSMQQSRWPMGKIVGGSMYLNNLVYLRGHSRDYKNWFGEAYNYEEDILPYFKRSEKQRGSYRNDSKPRGLSCSGCKVYMGF